MPTCYICGLSIPSGAVRRRKLRTGTNVSGIAFTSRPLLDWLLNSAAKGRAVGIRNSYSVRTICPDCDQQLTRRRRIQNLVIALFIVLLGLFLIVLKR
jgi:hypothetical protein